MLFYIVYAAILINVIHQVKLLGVIENPSMFYSFLFLFLGDVDTNRLTSPTQYPLRAFCVGFVIVSLRHFRHSIIKFLPNRVNGRLNIKPEIFFSA